MVSLSQDANLLKLYTIQSSAIWSRINVTLRAENSNLKILYGV